MSTRSATVRNACLLAPFLLLASCTSEGDGVETRELVERVDDEESATTTPPAASTQPAARSPQRPMGPAGMPGAQSGMGGQHMRGMGTAASGACPMAVPGVTVTAVTTNEGAALEFSADETASVDDVQSSVQAMAAHHNAMAGARGRMGGGAPGAGMGRGQMMRAEGSFAPMPHATVRAEETERGARLVFTADSAEERAALQQHIAMRAQHMQGGQTCPMGMMSMQGVAAPTDDGN